MGYDLRRAATALLAGLAVVLTAMLLPAAGVGSYPGVVGDPATPGTDAGPGSDAPSDVTETTPDRGDDPDRTTETTTGGDRTDERDETDETTTEQADARDAGGTGDGEDGAGAALGAVLFALVRAATLVTLAVTGVVTGGLLVGGVTAGPIRLRSNDAGGTLLEVFGLRVPLGGLRGLSRGSLRLVLGLSRSAGTLLSGLGSVGHGVVSAAAGGSLLSGVGSALTTVGTGLTRATLGVGSVLVSLSSGLGSIVSVTGWRPEVARGDSPTADARDAGATVSEGDGPPVDPGPQSVEEAWERFVERVPVRRPAARTPGEIARVAVERGWPATPVRRLTHTFREVRYGGVPADEDRTERAAGALDRMDDEGGDPR